MAGGACMAEGHAWQGGMCGRGHAWQIPRDGMHSCYSVRVGAYIHQLHSVPECGKYYLSPLSEKISLTYHLSPKG